MAKKKENNFDIKTILKIEKNIPKIRNSASSVQESIPLYAIHEYVSSENTVEEKRHSLFEIYPGYYTKNYDLQEINYVTASEIEQADYIEAWKEIYNILGNARFSQSIINKTTDVAKFSETILHKETGDPLDFLRRELNKINLERIKNGNNGIAQRPIITLGLNASSIKDAALQFKNLEAAISKSLEKLGSKIKEIDLEDRLELLHDIFNYGHEGEFIVKSRIMDEFGDIVDVNSFDLNNIRSMGLNVKDIIASACFNVKESYIELGDKYATVLQITNYSNNIKDTFYHNLSEQEFNLLMTLNVTPMSQEQAKNLLDNQLTMIKLRKEKIKEKNRKNQVDEDDIPLILIEQEEEIKELLEDYSKHDEHFFETTVTIVLFADTLEELNSNKEVIITTAKKSSTTVSTIRDMQEEGFITALPFTYDLSITKRTMKTTSVAMLIPFSNMELRDSGGTIYSQNAITKSIVSYDRISPKNLNYNGFILGISGSGKSYAAKLEQLDYRLKNHDVIVIDPEGEYGKTCRLVGGQEIILAAGANNCINPMDIYVGNSEVDPVLEKTGFILQLCQLILNSPFGLNAIQTSIIEQSVRELFAPFYDKDGVLQPISLSEMPTLTDLYYKIAARPEPEAREIAYALKLYTGDASFSLFGGHTTVDMENPYLVFNILNLSDNLKPVAMFIIISSIWNRVLRNRRLGKFTYVAIDEFHLLLKDKTTAESILGFWKRFRKFNGMITGITQNVSDLMKSEYGGAMLANSSFVMLLNQQVEDRELIKESFHLSDTMISYIKNSPKGQCLLLNPVSNICIPCYGPFPKDSIINKAITSDQREIKKYEEEERKKWGA